MEPLLITKTEFAPYRSLTLNIDDSKRLEPFILEAQRIDLSNLVGKHLYFDLLANLASYNAGVTAADIASTSYSPTTDEQWFQKLLNGCSYTHTWSDNSVTTKIYAGLKPVLVYLSYARFVRNDNVRSTQSGFVKKTVDFATQVSDKEIQAVANRAETDANAFFTSAEDFMVDNSSYFGKYIESKLPWHRKQRAGTKISAVKGKIHLNGRKHYILP